jgi:hypothetical protein
MTPDEPEHDMTETALYTIACFMGVVVILISSIVILTSSIAFSILADMGRGKNQHRRWDDF